MCYFTTDIGIAFYSHTLPLHFNDRGITHMLSLQPRGLQERVFVTAFQLSARVSPTDARVSFSTHSHETHARRLAFSTGKLVQDVSAPSTNLPSRCSLCVPCVNHRSALAALFSLVHQDVHEIIGHRLLISSSLNTSPTSLLPYLPPPPPVALAVAT